MTRQLHRLATLALLLMAGAACADEAVGTYWLDLDDELTSRDKAAYKVTVGPKQDDGLWPLAIDTIEDGGKVLRTFINDPDYTDDETDLVGEFTAYRFDDHTKEQHGHRDANGALDGVITDYRRDQSIKSTIEYKHGKRDGTMRCFDEHENIRCLTEYVDDKRHGVFKHFIKGKLFYIAHYRNDKREGVAEKYASPGDTRVVRERAHYHNDVPHGWFRYFNGGELKHEVHYAHAKKDGPERRFATNPHRPLSEHHYAQGKPVGSWKEYSGNGKLYREIVYADDGSQDVIARKRFNLKSGRLMQHEYVTGEDDERRRVEESFTREGYIHTRQIRYLDIDRRSETEYAPDGRVIQHQVRQDNQPTGSYIVFARGEEGSEQGHYNDQGKPQGKAERVDSDGNLAATFHYDNGKRDGQYISYDRQGRVIERGTYRQGQRVGTWRISEKNSDLIWRGTYDDDQRTGHWEVVTPDDELRAAGDYDDDGEEHGVWVIYDDDGQIRNCPRYDHGKRQDTPDFDAPDTPSAAAYCRDRLPDWARPSPT
ncbi:toxin-antitoxin system YwqK family antitoxin [Salinisphaera sp. Q1T1-3]|uniref:toxin-antitoxin system YwqK family antitoxin n=1 Tax=Salinisphaera sp. Q1T1-3 TaxID=2321229 RepID=UPI001F484570|nr:hypothetical protein [Salinisphaera sp. Q1T1-3]